MSIPAGWVEVTNGAWGLGAQRYPENVPTGAHYVDAFGNRCVATPDGQYKVEGIGTGVNAGKPDGEWWDWTEMLTAGPSNAEPWVEADGEASDNTHTIETPAVPLTIENPAPEASAPAPQPSLTIQKNADGRWEVRAVHATGEVITEAWDSLTHAMHNTWRWVAAHLHL